MATPLSPHFTLAELCQSSTATQRSIDNSTSDPAIIANLTALATNVLEAIRTQFSPFSPTSGYRCPALNAAVGGVPTSQHAYGQAADIVIAGVDLAVLGNWIIDNLDFDQVIHEHGGGATWIHVSYTTAATGNRKNILAYNGTSYAAVARF